GKGLKGLVQDRRILAPLGDSRFEIVRYNNPRHSSKEFQHPPAASNEVGFLLGISGFYIGVLATAQCGYKYFYSKLFSGMGINDVELLASIVDENFFSCLMLKVHRQSLSAQVFPDMFSELAGLETVWMFESVFFPETLACHAFFAQLFDYSRQKGKQNFQSVTLK